MWSRYTTNRCDRTQMTDKLLWPNSLEIDASVLWSHFRFWKNYMHLWSTPCLRVISPCAAGTGWYGMLPRSQEKAASEGGADYGFVPELPQRRSWLFRSECIRLRSIPPVPVLRFQAALREPSTRPLAFFIFVILLRNKIGHGISVSSFMPFHSYSCLYTSEWRNRWLTPKGALNISQLCETITPCERQMATS